MALERLLPNVLQRSDFLQHLMNLGQMSVVSRLVQLDPEVLVLYLPKQNSVQPM
jgi:hypothetical protein